MLDCQTESLFPYITIHVKGIEAGLPKPTITKPISGVASPMPLSTKEDEGSTLGKTPIQGKNPSGKNDAHSKLRIMFILRRDLDLCQQMDCLNMRYVSDDEC